MIKMHGLSERINISVGDFVMDVSDYEDTSKLLLAVDVLITDYSSIMFDFGLLKRPILLYMQDYDKYKKERGLYFDVEDTQLSYSTSSDALLAAIESLNYEAQEKIDNTPENLQSGERYERAQARQETFEEQYSELDTVYDTLSEIKDTLEVIE